MDLCRAAGRPPLGSRIAGAGIRALGPTGVARLAATLAGVPWSTVTAGGYRADPRPGPLTVRLAVPELCDALAALPDPEPACASMTSVRRIGAMNQRIRDGEPPVARIHPEDADPGPAILEGPGGRLAVTVHPDPDLPRGTVVLPFGDPRMNPNLLVGTAELEPFTGQPVSNGTPVRVIRPAPGAPATGR